MKEATEKTKNNVKDVWEFGLWLARILFALAITGLGVGAVVIGKCEVHTLIKEIALVVSGLCAVVDGIALLYKTNRK